MTFVEGDLLIVRNQDSVSHQLGPVWVPAQSSGVLEVVTANNYSYACSFQEDQVMGITGAAAFDLRDARARRLDDWLAQSG